MKTDIMKTICLIYQPGKNMFSCMVLHKVKAACKINLPVNKDPNF